HLWKYMDLQIARVCFDFRAHPRCLCNPKVTTSETVILIRIQNPASPLDARNGRYVRRRVSASRRARTLPRGRGEERRAELD
ncbi:hypothetical protein ACOJUR_00050, partial [Alicyclobacillus tolerans]|uniref:hypothetical protein n=1 Tax=Alicyclobacillus tolerans TaxID=90970 RepID=UPI003B82BB5E